MGLPSAALAAGGPWALVVSLVSLVVVSLLRGWLVPGKTVEREQQQLVTRAEDWKQAHALSEQAREIQARQLDEILDVVRATNATLAPSREAA